jgi:hypothetical protein
MTLGEISQFIGAIVAAGAYWEARAARKSSASNALKIEQVHVATNSLVTKLVDSTRTEAFAAGEKHEKERNGHSG